MNMEQNVNGSPIDIALLAPVPLMHLNSGKKLSDAGNKVPFGSNKWELFREMDSERSNEAVDVYIVATHTSAETAESELFWTARYVGHVVADKGFYPLGMGFRPDSTGSDTQFAVFWEVKSLKPVPRSEWGDISKMIPYTKASDKKKKPYGKQFVPQGPILIQHP